MEGVFWNYASNDRLIHNAILGRRRNATRVVLSMAEAAQ